MSWFICFDYRDIYVCVAVYVLAIFIFNEHLNARIYREGVTETVDRKKYTSHSFFVDNVISKIVDFTLYFFILSQEA